MFLILSNSLSVVLELTGRDKLYHAHHTIDMGADATNTAVQINPGHNSFKSAVTSFIADMDEYQFGSVSTEIGQLSTTRKTRVKLVDERLTSASLRTLLQRLDRVMMRRDPLAAALFKR